MHGAGRARGFERQNDSRCEIFDNDALAPAHGVLRVHQNRAAVVSQRLWGARVVVGSWSGEAFLECGARDVAKPRPARGGSRILAKARLRLQSRGISIPGHRRGRRRRKDRVRRKTCLNGNRSFGLGKRAYGSVVASGKSLRSVCVDPCERIRLGTWRKRTRGRLFTSWYLRKSSEYLAPKHVA